MPKYKAKAIDPIPQLNHQKIPNQAGWVTGSLVDGYIVGPLLLVDQHQFIPRWWCDVDLKTLQLVK